MDTKKILLLSLLLVMGSGNLFAAYTRVFYNATPYSVTVKVKIDLLDPQYFTISAGQSYSWTQPFWQALNLLKSVDIGSVDQQYVGTSQYGDILDKDSRKDKKQFELEKAKMPTPTTQGYHAPLGAGAIANKFIIVGPMGDQRNPHYQVSRMANPEILD